MALGGGEGVLGGWLDSGSDRLTFGCGVMRVNTSVVAPSVMSAGSSNMFGCALVVFSFGMLDVFADMCFQFSRKCDLILKYFHFIPKLKIFVVLCDETTKKRSVVSCSCFTRPCSIVDSCKLDLWLSNLKL